MKEAVPNLQAMGTSELVSELASTLGAMAERHIELAKVEAIAQLKREMRAVAFMAVAAVVALFGALVLLAAAVLALSLEWPAWLASLTIGGGLIGIALVLGAVGYRNRVQNVLKRSRAQAAEEVRWVARTA